MARGGLEGGQNFHLHQHRGVKVIRGSFSANKTGCKAVLNGARHVCEYEVTTAVTTERNVILDSSSSSYYYYS
jgi:hypothetical protein